MARLRGRRVEVGFMIAHNRDVLWNAARKRSSLFAPPLVPAFAPRLPRVRPAFAPPWGPPPPVMGLDPASPASGASDPASGADRRLGARRSAPEILAPAGAHDSLSAALAAGADAVYFGLDDGFNARARATNFASGSLAETVAWIHRAGVRAYVTLNTLVFEPELPIVEELIRRIAAAGTDAIIVQDPAVALLARAICPALEVHGSTQMTASSPLAAELLRGLGLTRVVVPRELSVDEIRQYAAGTRLPLEVFIHGALCVSWSGQCLSSEAWGGRSANRGQCAQACRLPYQLIVDGDERDLGDVAYLLSPKDLVGLDAVPALAEIGVASLKIEGRLKGPHYVATAVAQYRAATAATTGAPPPASPVRIPADEPSLHIAYSRGISRGFLGGADHQTLVEGRFPQHRGVPLGRVARIAGDSVLVIADPAQRPITGGLALDDAPVGHDATDARTRVIPRAGMGVVFDHARPREPEQGGPIFAIGAPDGAAGAPPDGHWLRFGSPGPDLASVHPGDLVWITSDPKISRAGEKAAEAGLAPLGRIAVDLAVRGEAGAPLEVVAIARGHTVRAATATLLEAARGPGLARDVIADKLGALGGTAFHLGAVDTERLAGGLHVPVNELKKLRRTLVAELTAALERVDRTVAPASAGMIEAVTAGLGHGPGPGPAGAPIDRDPIVVPLCRTDAQLDAVLDAGAREVELDWMELVGLRKAVDRARRRGARVGIATLRIQKPGEASIDQHLARLAPDHVLVRNWGSLAVFSPAASAARPSGEPPGPAPPILHGDFSLNVTNSITAAWVLDHGLATLTAAHDLDREQLFALLDRAPRGRIAVTVHHHVPTFHTEHCVYAHLLSTGRDYRTCGRPCERHEVALRDRVGLVHPVVVDVGCRNTIFNAQAQSAASMVPELLARGVRRLRVELVRESADEAARVVTAYTALAAGQLAPREVVRRAAVHEQFGVTRGTMRTLTVLR
jgi:U32 family peptidase